MLSVLALFSLSVAAAAPPAEAVAEALTAGGWSVGGEVVAADAGPWWPRFGDPALTAVVEAALAGNGDHAAAWERAQAARFRAGVALAPALPTVSFEHRQTEGPSDSLGFQFGGLPQVPGAPAPPDTFTTGSDLFTAAWAVDVFGRTLMAWKGSRWDAKAAEGDRQSQAIALATTAAEAYYDLVLARARVQVVEAQLARARELHALVDLRYQAGTATSTELLQQRQQLAAVEATLPAAQAAADRTVLRLRALMGEDPSAPRAIDAAAALPAALPAAPPLGRPVDLLRNRPDVAAAVAQLTAADARVWSARVGLLPTLTLSGNTGQQFFDLTERREQDIWGATLAVSVPLFQGGRNIQSARDTAATERAARSNAQQRLRVAVQEVEDALRVEAQRGAELEARGRQADAARMAWEDARLRYQRGLEPYQNVLTAFVSFANAELLQLQARRDLLSARIQLQDALGGTWARDFEPGDSSR
jgi:NodT family efflux transporter outer membrane factor (OMF) lipoprotein